MRIDTRAGSKEFIEPLRAMGVEVEEAILPAGDVEIVGNGPGGTPKLVGVELKTIEDVAACVRSGRFAEQQRRMKESFEVSWLLIEGRWRGDPKGLAVERGPAHRWFVIPGHITHQEIVAWSLTMAQCGGTLLWRTESRAESVAWLRALELWWTAKEWEDHRAHLDWYSPPLNHNPFEGEPSLAHKWAAELPGVGDKKARGVAKRFGSAYLLANATEAELVEVEGVGKKLAKGIVAAIRETK